MKKEGTTKVREKKRGRPIGYKLSEDTKDKIRQKRLGTCHTKETKDKISQSLIKYFKRRDALSKSIEYEYSYISKEAADWAYENRERLDDVENVMTEKRLLYLKQLEICLGSDIENIFGHEATPEFMLLLKEEIKHLGYDIQELYSLI